MIYRRLQILTTHIQCSSDLQGQGEAGNNAISLDKLVMLSCDVIIVPDT